MADWIIVNKVDKKIKTKRKYFLVNQVTTHVDTQQAKRLKELEKENDRLKKLVAELSLDNAILKDVNSKNW